MFCIKFSFLYIWVVKATLLLIIIQSYYFGVKTLELLVPMCPFKVWKLWNSWFPCLHEVWNQWHSHFPCLHEVWNQWHSHFPCIHEGEYNETHGSHVCIKCKTNGTFLMFSLCVKTTELIVPMSSCKFLMSLICVKTTELMFTYVFM